MFHQLWRCQRNATPPLPANHYHCLPSLSLSLYTGTRCKNPSPRALHSLERAPRSTWFRVRVRTSVCVSPGQVNVLSLVVKRDREKERKSGERERKRGVRKGERRRRHDPSNTLALPPPFSLSTIPLDECISSSADAKGALLNSQDPWHYIRARGAIAFYESTCEVALRTLLKRFVRVRFLKLYSRARDK